MKYRKYVVLPALAAVMLVHAAITPVTAFAEPADNGMEPAAVTYSTEPETAESGLKPEIAASSPEPKMIPGWNQSDCVWHWVTQDGNLHRGWLQDNGRTFYLNEDGAMITGWKEIDGDWYYFHEDGAMNLGELILDNGKYQFSAQGTLVSASWLENTGGGAYDAGCYDDQAQDLFDQLNDEKRDQYFDEHPHREDEYDGDSHRVYDRYAGFQMDMTLNRAAAHRLEAAEAGGYADDSIPGEGSINDYLTLINYRRNASCLELYVQNCEDGSEAFDKVMTKLDKQFQAKTDRKYSLEYYRRLGMAHEERDGKHYFMIILMR